MGLPTPSGLPTMTSANEIETYRLRLQQSFDDLVSDISDIPIGDRRIFPYGWRKAAKGRTVWRILEEAVVQNLEAHPEKYGLATIEPSDSEVSIYDLKVKFPDLDQFVFVNIKSAVKGGRKNKDDISKAVGLLDFFDPNRDKILFVVTIEIGFEESMKVKLERAFVMPIAWLPDIYVNPSNNGNLQSSKYKDVPGASKRSTSEFVDELIAANNIAQEKRNRKARRA